MLWLSTSGYCILQLLPLAYLLPAVSVVHFEMRLELKFLPCILAIFVQFQNVASEVLEKLFENASPCETRCNSLLSSRMDLTCLSCCKRGCRLFTMIDLAKENQSVNITTEACFSACTEAYFNSSDREPCFLGCEKQASFTHVPQESEQTLHLLTPLLYIKSAYNILADHVRRFITTSWTVYLQQDTGKVVLVHSGPHVQETKDNSDSINSRVSNNPTRLPPASFNYHSNWEGKTPVGWMDCISYQSGLPRWLLVAVLFGFIVALVWLCCATAVTAPQHYVNSVNSKKSPPSQDAKYILVCEPSDKMPLVEEAPPCPAKKYSILV